MTAPKSRRVFEAEPKVLAVGPKSAAHTRKVYPHDRDPLGGDLLAYIRHLLAEAAARRPDADFSDLLPDAWAHVRRILLGETVRKPVNLQCLENPRCNAGPCSPAPAP